MNSFNFKVLMTVIAGLFVANASWAQLYDAAYNPHTIRPVRADDIAFQKTIWVRADLRQKINQPFMAEEGELARLIIDAVKAGVLLPFTNDSLATRMNTQAFLERLTVETPESDFPEWEEPWDSTEETDPWVTETEEETAPEPIEYFPKQLYIVELKTNVFFDKKRSRQYHQIEAVTFIIPGELHPAGIEQPLATFSFKELATNVFADNPRAIAFNADNTAEHWNLTDAFELALMQGTIVQYTNPQGQVIADMYPMGKQALGAAEQYKHRLMEQEHNVWSH